MFAAMIRRSPHAWLVRSVCASLALSPVAAQQRAIDRAVERAHDARTKQLDIWEDHSTFENAWLAETEHFAVRTTASYGLARDLAAGLETMLGHFHSVLGVDFTPPAALPVFVLPDRAAYNAFGEQHGEHHSSFYGSFHASNHPEQPVAVAWDPNPTLLRMHVTHSVVHQYLHRAFPASAGNRPAWVEEGLAAYFTSYWALEWTRQEYLRAKDDARLVSLPRILRDDVAAFSADTEVRMLQLAVLFDWLLRLREDTKSTQGDDGAMRGPFRDYLVAVLEGRDTRDLPFRAVLQDPAKLAADFAAFEFPQ